MHTSIDVVLVGPDDDDGYHECARCGEWYWNHPNYHACNQLDVQAIHYQRRQLKLSRRDRLIRKAMKRQGQVAA